MKTNNSHILTIITSCLFAMAVVVHAITPKCICHEHMVMDSEEDTYIESDIISEEVEEPEDHTISEIIEIEVEEYPIEGDIISMDYDVNQEISSETSEIIIPRDELSREWITIYSDIVVPTSPSVEDIDALIDYWHPRISHGQGTRFKGYGWAFYQAWEETGIDPLILLGIAAWEGGWGNSPIAVDKNNFYGIGAFDYDPYGCAKELGDSIAEGIINGAKWIKKHYYDKGYTTMYSINVNGYNPSLEWSNQIVNDMINSHYSIIQTITKEDI